MVSTSLSPLVAERRLVDDAGDADRQHVGGAHGGGDDAGPLLRPLGNERLQPFGQLVGMLLAGAA